VSREKSRTEPERGQGADEPTWSDPIENDGEVERGPKEWQGNEPTTAAGANEPAWATPRKQESRGGREARTTPHGAAPPIRTGDAADTLRGRKRMLVVAAIVVALGLVLDVAGGVWLLQSGRSSDQRSAPTQTNDGAKTSDGDPGATNVSLPQVMTDLSAALRKASEKVLQLETELAAVRGELKKSQQELSDAQSKALHAAVDEIAMRTCEQQLADLQHTCTKDGAAK